MATIVDSYSESNRDADAAIYNVHPTASAAWPSASYQSFTGDGQNLFSCKFYLAQVGTPGNLIARLYAHSGTFGSSSVPTGAALDSSNTVDANTICGSIVLVAFTCFTSYTIVNGTKNNIVLVAIDGMWTETSDGVLSGRL